MENTCNECQHVLFGRSDKKFCDEACRISFNNKKNAAQSLFSKTVMRVLRANVKILKNKMTEQKLIVDQLDLEILGFNFNYHTFVHDKDERGQIKFCFEYGYYLTKENKYALVKVEDYTSL